MTQMEQWSILSNILNHVQHDRYHTMKHTLSITVMNRYKNNLQTKEEKNSQNWTLAA